MAIENNTRWIAELVIWHNDREIKQKKSELTNFLCIEDKRQVEDTWTKDSSLWT